MHHTSFRRILSSSFIVILAGCQTIPLSQSGEGSSSLPSSEAATSVSSSAEQISVIADSLAIPWDIAFLPDGDLLVTERPGTLLRIGKNNQRYPINGVLHRGEGGLLGVELHPDFEKNNWVYLYLTTSETGGVTNRVERYTLSGDQLIERVEILSNIPGSQFHDGGRLAFGPDGYLYITTGDASNEANAQSKESLAGKILRLRDDGFIPTDNPFGNATYSFGHRNPQGLAWDDEGHLWATEHGRSGIASGYDELNRIEPGSNYGWPNIQGDETYDGMMTPVLHSGPSTTWAPASAAYWDGSIFFGGLRGEALYEAVLTDPPTLNVHLQNDYGRIRTVDVGPDGMLYLTTSNTDGRGSASANDDRIIRVDPQMFR